MSSEQQLPGIMQMKRWWNNLDIDGKARAVAFAIMVFAAAVVAGMLVK
jgi:hypothetical protein